MDGLLLYYILLALWVPLLWPAFRLRGWKRGALLVIALGGALPTASEIWQAFGPPNAIRIDALLFTVVLITLYAAAVAILLIARWRVAAGIFALVLFVAGGGLVYKWGEAVAESRRLDAKFDERNRLLFKARFRDRATYDTYFGPFSGSSGRFPVGHWQAPDGARFTRLIVNGDGQAWLFYPCGNAECNYRPSTRPLERAADGALREWRGNLRPPVGELLPVRIVRRDKTALSVEAYGKVVDFTMRPPPIDPEPREDVLVFLGTFSEGGCIRQHAVVRQVSLWQQGGRLFAVGVFQTLVAGRVARFVTPAVMGEGRPNGDGWDFEWKVNGEKASATVTPVLTSIALSLTLPRRDAETVNLPPGTVFADETIDLAPRTGAADWKHWFDTVWVGHFLAGRAPVCPQK